MRGPRSLQGRLALGLGLGLTVLWLGAAWVTATLLRSEMNEVFDSTLEETAQRILPLAVLEILDTGAEGPGQRIATLREHDEYFTYLVRDDEGRILMRSHAADDADFPPFDGTGFRRTQTHRLYHDAALQSTITITVAEPLARRAAVARRALMALALPLIAIIPLSLLGMLVIVRRSLGPVRGFGAALSQRGARDLSPIGQSDLPAEIITVADAVNQLFDRLSRALEAERSFTANAAHELRTPIAAALAQTQRLMSEIAGPAAGERAAGIEAALKRLARLSEKLMHLARVEGGRLRSDTASDIRPVLNMVLSDFERGAGAGRIERDLPGGLVLSDIDRDAFAILARNLIENALRHGEPGTPVQVDLSADGALRVTNECAPVPPEILARLSARFTRGQSLSDGSGLGLSIAKAIADGASGHLTLHSPAPGRSSGFAAVFQLPSQGKA